MATRWGATFDLEGTLVNLEKIHFGAFVAAARDFGLRLTFKSLVTTIPNAIGGGDAVIAHGIHLLGGRRVSVRTILSRKNRYYEERLRSVAIIRVRPGALKVIQWFQEQGFPTAIGSLTPRIRARRIIRSSGLVNLFPNTHIVLAEDVKNHKPEPDVYLETATRMGILPEHQIVFEDSVVGLEAARLAGSHGVGMPIFRTPEYLSRVLTAGAKRIFMDWREINTPWLVKNLQGRKG